MMKHIFFYSNHFNDDETIGITQKVHGEISALRELGYSVTYSAYTDSGVAIFDNNDNQIFAKQYKCANPRINRVLRRGLLLKCCCEFLKLNNGFKFDFAYLRFHFFDEKYNKLLDCFKKKQSFVIVEVHAFPYRIWNNVLIWPTYILDIIFTPIVRKKIDLVAIMGKEQKLWGINSIQIDNGIELEKYPLSKSESSSTIRLISVTNEHAGHAYYKVVKGLASYYKNEGTEDIIVNFVGEYMDSTKKLISDLKIEKRFKLWGKMSGVALDTVFDEVDLGLGAFSHRKDDTGSCIKTKEYFARGIPFINGWKEIAFDNSYPYVLKVDTRDSEIDFFKVVEFYKGIQRDVKKKRLMREFAYKNYTWISQMSKVMKKAEETL